MAQMHAMMQEMLANSNASARQLSEETAAKQAAESALFRSRGEQVVLQQEMAAHHHRAEESAAAATSEARVAKAVTLAEQHAMLVASQSQHLRAELLEAAKQAQDRDSKLEHSTNAVQEAQARALQLQHELASQHQEMQPR